MLVPIKTMIKTNLCSEQFWIVAIWLFVIPRHGSYDVPFRNVLENSLPNEILYHKVDKGIPTYPLNEELLCDEDSCHGFRSVFGIYYRTTENRKCNCDKINTIKKF